MASLTIFLTLLNSYFELLKANVPTANIVIFYASSGSYANTSNPLFLGKFWAAHLADKLVTTPGWPFNSTAEFFDTKSNPSRVTSFCQSRFTNKLLPNVSAILGPAGTPVGYAAAAVAVKYNIPVVFANGVAYATTNGIVSQLPTLASSFFLLPSGFVFSTTIDAYQKAGVQTVFVAYFYSPASLSNQASCQAAAVVAQQRGLEVLGVVQYTAANTTQDLYQIVLQIKSLNPDVVIWCESQSCTQASRLPYHVLPLFKQANYLPKALTLNDCVDHPLTSAIYEEGLYLYVSSGQGYHARCSGNDYTEDFTPYSSLFRPKTPAVFTVSTTKSIFVLKLRSQTKVHRLPILKIA